MPSLIEKLQSAVLNRLGILTSPGRSDLSEYGQLDSRNVREMRSGDAAILNLHYANGDHSANGTAHAVLVGRFAGTGRWYYLDPAGQRHIAPTLPALRLMISANDARGRGPNSIVRPSAFVNGRPDAPIMLLGGRRPSMGTP